MPLKQKYGNKIEITKTNVQDSSLHHFLSLEWLDTNQLGGYSSSTVLNCHTRRYHGLLVTELSEPPGKFVLLSKIEDTLQIDNQEYPLTTHQYPNFIYEGGYPFFVSFQNETHPTFLYQCGSITLCKEILLLTGENTVLIKYHLQSSKPIKNARIQIRPFIAYRDFHSLSKANDSLNQVYRDCQKGICLTPYQSMPTLYLQSQPISEFAAASSWYKNFEYQEEQKRGFDFHEDLYTPGLIALDFDENNNAFFACSLIEQKLDLDLLWKNELASRNKFLKQVDKSEFEKTLKTSAKQFLSQHNATETSIIAGYHWFLEWGRDAMISLPGLTLFSGLEKEYLNILIYFASHQHEGLIPNYISQDEKNNAYNTVDASLWFAWAVQQYYLKTNNLEAIKKYLWQTLKNIFTWYQQGTLGGSIKQQENGLIYAGNGDLNLTWMDACVHNMPVTSRYGMQVEINALWYNMLNFMNDLAIKLKDPIGKQLDLLQKQVQKSFQEVFWNKELGYLYDVVNEEKQDSSIRPNQIFAVSLPFSPVNKLMAKNVVRVVQTHLLTPYGLRTLSPIDKNYIGHYAGDSVKRDSAYHQGTVWPWLLGHFCEALLKVTSKKEAYKILEPCIAGLKHHVLNEAGLGGVSEIFDGDLPHHPNGCINQAWSVAEFIRLLHLLIEDQ